MERRSDDTNSLRKKNSSSVPFLTERVREVDSHCVLRADSSGFLNFFQAWSPFLFHLLACVLLFVSMSIWVDGHNFNTGSPDWVFQFRKRLFQTQVNGLVSVALVLIRLLGGCCTTLLVWRMIFILLEKRGMTLEEISYLDGFRIPLLPRPESRRKALWTCLAMMITIFLWPPMLAAPLANSSLAWIPSEILTGESSSLTIAKSDNDSDWDALLYASERMGIVLNAASMALREPRYAFDRDSIPVRRHFTLSNAWNGTGLANLSLPYFDVSFRWIDASSDSKAEYAGKPIYSDMSGVSWEMRADGTVTILRDSQWDQATARPSEPQLFEGKRTVAIKVATRYESEPWLDGSFPTAEGPCMHESSSFSSLPDVEYWGNNWHWDGGKGDFVAKECFILAEATIRAGMYSGKDCNMSSAGDGDHYATCKVPKGPVELQGDWLTGLTLDTISEVMRYIMVLSIDQAVDPKTRNTWIRDDIEDYMAGMLRLAYHATWSSFVQQLNKGSNETISGITSENVVVAFMDRLKMIGWLVMNLTLALAAVLVYVAQSLSATKTVRNTTVAALTMDLSEITHSHVAPGLCNAVELSKRDKQLGRMEWVEVGSKDVFATGRESTSFGGHCRRLRLVDKVDGTLTEEE